MFFETPVFLGVRRNDFSAQIFGVDQRVTANTTAIGDLNVRVDGIDTRLTVVEAGLVIGTLAPIQYRSDADPSFPSAVPTNTVGLVGADASEPVLMTNVAAGAVAAGSTDAVNGSQLAATEAQLGDAEDAIAVNTADIASNTAAITTNTTAITANTTAIAANSDRIDDNTAAIAVNSDRIDVNSRDIALLGAEIGSATTGPLRYSTPDAPTTPNDGTRTNDVVLVGATPGAEVALHNVADGTAPTDAVNVRQLGQASEATFVRSADYTDARIAEFAATVDVMGQAMNAFDGRLDQFGTRLDAVEFNLSDYRRDAEAGIAGATALANMPQPMDRGASMIAGGVGHHRGETAFAIGFSSAFEGGLIVKAGASVDTRGAGTFGAGAGFQF